jgi:hypothetical protein
VLGKAYTKKNMKIRVYHFQNDGGFKGSISVLYVCRNTPTLTFFVADSLPIG